MGLNDRFDQMSLTQCAYMCQFWYPDNQKENRFRTLFYAIAINTLRQVHALTRIVCWLSEARQQYQNAKIWALWNSAFTKIWCCLDQTIFHIVTVSGSRVI